MIELAQDLAEELELSAWPGKGQMVRGGWLIRIANGFTSRANSASAICREAELSEADLAAIEAIFARHGLPAIFRIGAHAPMSLDQRLAERGYRIKTPSTRQQLDLTGQSWTVDPAVSIDTAASAAWVDDFGRCNSRNDFDAETMRAILGNILPQAFFGRLVLAGTTVAIGVGVLDRGILVLQSIGVDPAQRGAGLGRRMVNSLLARGQSAGARAAILNVDDGNAPAQALYASLGFRITGRYHYRIRS